MKNLTYLVTLGGLMFAINVPAQANTLSSNVQITDGPYHARQISLPTTSSPAPGSDRR
jgi:hypothetical protein